MPYCWTSFTYFCFIHCLNLKSIESGFWVCGGTFLWNQLAFIWRSIQFTNCRIYNWSVISSTIWLVPFRMSAIRDESGTCVATTISPNNHYNDHNNHDYHESYRHWWAERWTLFIAAHCSRHAMRHKGVADETLWQITWSSTTLALSSERE